jgi:hypothetical protein
MIAASERKDHILIEAIARLISACGGIPEKPMRKVRGGRCGCVVVVVVIELSFVQPDGRIIRAKNKKYRFKFNTAFPRLPKKISYCIVLVYDFDISPLLVLLRNNFIDAIRYSLYPWQQLALVDLVIFHSDLTDFKRYIRIRQRFFHLRYK